MHKEKQRAATNYPPAKPSGFYPIPSVAEIKVLFPPQVRTKGVLHLCTVEEYAKKGYHLQSDYLFGDDKQYKTTLCHAITELLNLSEGNPDLSVSIAGFLGGHLQPVPLLTANVAQLLK